MQELDKDLNRIEYLLAVFDRIPEEMKNIRKIFIVDNDSYKILINAILETKYFNYIKDIPSVPIRVYTDIGSSLNILDIEKRLSNYTSSVKQKELKHVFEHHYNHIFRVSAFVTDFILQVNSIFKKE